MENTEIIQNKYENGKIYKLVSKHTDKIYIGSTCKSLDERLKKHESHFLNYFVGKHSYLTSFEILELGDYSIELEQLFPCENKQQLFEREAFYIRKYYGNVTNKNIASRTRKQYYSDNKEKEKEQQKIWYEANKERVREYKKQYDIDNKEKKKAYKQKPFHCLCGKIMTNDAKYLHFKSKLHLKFLNNPIIIEEDEKLKLLIEEKKKIINEPKIKEPKIKVEKPKKIKEDKPKKIKEEKPIEIEQPKIKTINLNDLKKRIKKISSISKKY